MRYNNIADVAKLNRIGKKEKVRWKKPDHFVAGNRKVPMSGAIKLTMARGQRGGA